MSLMRSAGSPPGSSSGYAGKRRVVNAHPVGSLQTCYVDPDDPAASVINRGFTAGMVVLFAA